ncbi:exosome complex component RRP4 homolog isoform X2 [Cucumis melo]|uniref:Exosome complex component RRP4 homolog isoform X2 n=1 Tax=Cucumis melo TaxID=3656 RepID=A0A1S3CLC6_CUCME|nr:exosome complex component RRP4 homolog isoform X2 [Cucumis melo]
MRGLQIFLNHTQQTRLKNAQKTLESLSSKANYDASVAVGDTVPFSYEDGVLKGHGTLDLNGEVVTTICGVVERVNKLIYVRSLRARYKPEIGDIVVGRVTEVAPKRWRLDIHYSQDAVLMLSSMNLPDGIQRRRTAVDELNMRSIFEENDVICAEVRGFQHDGLHLQARSQKYGKLERGQLLTVSPYLVKRRKQHFHHLEQYGIDLILGCNGFIWIGKHVDSTQDTMIEDQVNKIEQKGSKFEGNFGNQMHERVHTPLETRQNICRTANAIRVLSILGFIITVEVIMETVSLSISLNINVHEMLGLEFFVLVAEKEVERRSCRKKRG